MVRFGPTLCLALLGGCLAPDARSCSDSAECRLEGRRGRCEPIGYCAYPNDACPLGYSFSPYAPEELANGCISEEDVEETSGTGGPTCESGCDGLELLGEWTLDEPFELVDVLVGPGEALVVGGNVSTNASIVDLRGSVALSVPDFELVGLATDGDAIALGGQMGGKPTLLLTGAALQQPTMLRRWSSGGQDALAGIGSVDAGGWVVGGLALGRAWVEVLAADGVTQWAHQWDGESPVSILGRGGLAYAISPGDAGIEARAFTSSGAVTPAVVLGPNLDTVVGATISATGIAYASGGVAVGSPHRLQPPLEVSIGAATGASAALDGAGELVVARQQGSLFIETYDPTGAQTGSIELAVPTFGALHARTDDTGAVVVLARVGQAQVSAWRVE